MTALIVGTYAKAGGPGLVPMRMAADGCLTEEEAVATIANTSAGLRHGDRWYFVDEEAGSVSVHAGPERGWAMLARVPSGGDAPCHLAVDPSGQRLAVANYGSGTVALFPLDDAGLPQAPAIQHGHGRGPNSERQEGPHAHWVGFAGARLYSTDLGLDRVFALGSDLVRVSEAYRAPPGSGPRQIAIHPALPCAYLVSELAATLTVLRIESDGSLSDPRIMPSSEKAVPDNLGGAIIINRAGDRLYVSNRGADTVATFAVNNDGSATPLGETPSGGSSPRFLLLLEDERRLLVAHEKSGGITTLDVDGEGHLSLTEARLDAPGACFLAVLED